MTVIDITDNKRCRDCACYHSATDLCVVKKEKVDYLDKACEEFVWD